MKLFILFMIISVSTWARVEVNIIPQKTILKQGEIFEAELRLVDPAVKYDLSVLVGKNIGETVYILDVESSKAKAIFSKVPLNSQIAETINGEEILLSWQDLEVIATEEPKSFIFGDFSIPSPLKLFYWLLGFIALILLGVGFFRWKKIREEKQKVILRRKKLKESLMKASTYADIVHIWEQKKTFLKEFPQIEEAFIKFESILFLYQFKPERTELELSEVASAYKKLKDFVQQGVGNGI